MERATLLVGSVFSSSVCLRRSSHSPLRLGLHLGYYLAPHGVFVPRLEFHYLFGGLVFIARTMAIHPLASREDILGNPPAFDSKG